MFFALHFDFSLIVAKFCLVKIWLWIEKHELPMKKIAIVTLLWNIRGKKMKVEYLGQTDLNIVFFEKNLLHNSFVQCV